MTPGIGSLASVALTARPATAADEPLLRTLFAQSRIDLAGLPSAVRESLIDVQYRAQRARHAAAFPGASCTILMVDGYDCGAVVVDPGGSEHHILDLTVLIAYRRRGIARAALGLTLANAAARGHTTRLAVWSANTSARSLCERAGFEYEPGGEDDGELRMFAVPTRRHG